MKDGERCRRSRIDALTAPSGLETALGAALGEELTSALDPEAARYWRELPPLDPVPRLPEGAPGVFRRGVGATAALRRSLSQIGLVEDERVARDCQIDMAPGQVLVSREGAVWRWDGYTIRAGTPTSAAVRLRQRNRLNGLRDTLADAVREAVRTTSVQAEADQDRRGRRSRRNRGLGMRAGIWNSGWSGLERL